MNDKASEAAPPRVSKERLNKIGAGFAAAPHESVEIACELYALRLALANTREALDFAIAATAAHVNGPHLMEPGSHAREAFIAGVAWERKRTEAAIVQVGGEELLAIIIRLPTNEQEALAMIRAGSKWLDDSRERPTPAEVAALDGT